MKLMIALLALTLTIQAGAEESSIPKLFRASQVGKSADFLIASNPEAIPDELQKIAKKYIAMPGAPTGVRLPEDVQVLLALIKHPRYSKLSEQTRRDLEKVTTQDALYNSRAPYSTFLSVEARRTIYGAFESASSASGGGAELTLCKAKLSALERVLHSGQASISEKQTGKLIEQVTEVLREAPAAAVVGAD